jgi:hypothetical protein
VGLYSQHRDEITRLQQQAYRNYDAARNGATGMKPLTSVRDEQSRTRERTSRYEAVRSREGSFEADGRIKQRKVYGDTYYGGPS